jgi:thiol-disulfide isomerase/thioredoxin
VGRPVEPATIGSSAQTVTRSGNAGAGPDIEPGLDLYPPDQRKPAPQLEGSTLDGKPFTLVDLSSKTVVVNVWGSWCPPCRAESPDLVRLADEEAGSATPSPSAC